jgi:hypothetical protein
MELFCRRAEWAFAGSGKTAQRGNRERMSEAKRHQKASIWREIDGMRQQTVGQLKVKYRAVFGQESRSNHKQFLLRRIAWRLQANAEGGLSERARLRAVALAEEADLRMRAPESFLKELANPGAHRACDPRLPAPGQWLHREFQGQTVSVEVLVKGFRHQETVYKSLSAVARHVTGVQWNGFSFFGLIGRAERHHGS